MSRRGWIAGAGLAAMAWRFLAHRGAPSALRSPDLIAHADSYKPAHLADYAKKLASQPDMTGAWKPLPPADAGPGPIFDPEHGVWSGRLQPGESTFGPLPGTYIKDIPYRPEYRKK